MRFVRPLLRSVPALTCFAVGLAQLAWVWWLVGNSLHMGSPIRLHGRFIVRSIEDLTLRGRAEYQHEVGMLGFELLGHSMWIHFACGLTLLGLAVVLVVLAIIENSRSNAAHRTVGGA